MYGLPPDADIVTFQEYGFVPALSWIVYPTLVKVASGEIVVIQVTDTILRLEFAERHFCRLWHEVCDARRPGDHRHCAHWIRW